MPRDQFELIKLLGSTKYMNTNLTDGTSAIDLMSGLEKYLNDRGYEVSIKYHGRQGKELGNFGKYYAGEILNPELIRNKILNDERMILRIGYYEHDKKEGTYKRLDGHYVTVVGFKENSQDEVYVHDPSKYSGFEPKTETFKLVPINFGNIVQYRVEGMKTAPEKPDFKPDFVALDAVISFKIKWL